MSSPARRPFLLETVTNERGVALPLAMLTLVILTVLSLAFMALSKSEPIIASNHQRATEARAVAESGLERALWALTTTVIPANLVGVAATPYNGGQFVTLNSRGGAFITVSSNSIASGGQTCTPAGANERCVLAIGWSPTNTAGTSTPSAHRQILATVMKLTNLAINAPCALCVAGELQVGGNTTIDSTADTSCGQKYATMTAGCTALGSGSCGGAPGGGSYSLKGSVDGNNVANQATDYVQNAGTAAFPAFTLTSADMKALRALAKANGTYYQGTVSFNSSNKVKNGIVFVDTVSGNDPTASTSASDLAVVDIHGNPFLGVGADDSFRGWLIVNGSLSISGNMKLNGLAYAANDFSYNGTGTGAINGLVISQNVLDTSATSIDTSTGGNSTIALNCQNVQGGGFVPQGWFVKAGTYMEPHD
jgi:Tfp pilus assembly protein PilX